MSTRIKNTLLCVAGLTLALASPLGAKALAGPATQDVVVTFLDLEYEKFTPTNLTMYLDDHVARPDEVSEHDHYFDNIRERKLTTEYTGRGGTEITTTVRLKKPNNGTIWITFVIDPATGELKERRIKVDNLPRDRWRAGVQPDPAGGASTFPASVSSSNGRGVNPSAFSSTDSPVLGKVFYSKVDHDSTGAIASLVKIGLGGDLDPGLALGIGELLTQPPFLSTDLSTSGVHALHLPNDVTLSGLSLSTQAVVVKGPSEQLLTNRLTLTLGF